MIYLKRFHLKDFVLFYLLVLLFGCSSLSQDSNKTSGEPISIQENFSIEEILSAVSDLQNLKKKKDKFSNVSKSKFDNSDIPKNTLKLIEEAEKSKN